MAIQNRRGSDKDFNPDKMVPAEIAITTDGTRKIYVCFSAGDVIELLSAIETEFTEEELQRCVDNYLAKNPLQLDETLTDNAKAAPAGIVGDIKSDKINIPKDSNGNTLNGTGGQILQTNGDGTTQWVNKPEAGTPGDEVSAHNADENAHSDIRNLISGKVSTSNIADNLTSNNSNKVLSAAQGVKLKAMIDKLGGFITWIDAYSYVKDGILNVSDLNLTDNSIVYFKKGEYRVAASDIDGINNVLFLMNEAVITCTGAYFIKADNCNDIAFIGGTISGATDYGIAVNDCLRPLFRKVAVTNCGGSSVKEATGIRIYGDCSGFAVEHCRVSDISAGAISTDDYIHAYGIFVNRMSSSNTYSKYGKITDCVVDNVYGIDNGRKKGDGDGIFIQNPPYLDGDTIVWRELDVVVERCTLTNCKKRGLKSASVGVTIRNCRFVGDFYGAAIDFQYGHGKAIDCYIENTSDYTGATTCGIVTTEGGVELRGNTIKCAYNGGYQNGFRMNPRLPASVVDDSVPWERIVIDDCYFDGVANAVSISSVPDVSYTLKGLEITNCRFGRSNAANMISMGEIFSAIGTFCMIDFRFDAGTTRTEVKNANSNFSYPTAVFANTTECYEIYSRYWIDAPVAGNSAMPTSHHARIIFAGDLSGIKYKEYTSHGSRIYGTRDPNTTTATLAKQLLYNSKKGDMYFDVAAGVIYKCTTAGTDSNIGAWESIGQAGGSGDANVAIVVTPEQYGAVGDGKTDDTDAIKNAIQAVADSGGGIVLMRKEYLVTSTITLALNVILEGISKFASIIMKAQESSAVYVPGLNKHTGIKNLSIRGNFNVSSHSSMKRSYIGLQIGKPDADKSADENALYYSVFENVMIYGFGTGLDVNLYSWTLFAKGFRIEKCFHGMWNYSTDNSFEDFAISGCYGDGLHIQYSGNCKYRNFFVERNGRQKQALGGSGEDVTTYYGINYRGGENDIFSGITLIENHGHGFFCQYARNCYLDGIFAEMNGYYKYLNSGVTLETKGIEFKLCKGVFGSIFGRNHDSNNPSQDKLFSTESCENMSIFYAEQNVPKASTYSGTNVRFLSNADIANLGTGSSSGGSGTDYTLPVATADTLGGVKPVGKTSAMTQSVGVDSEGRLYAAPTISETETSWYSGKKIVCYGTSITEQGQSISKWMSNIAKVLGCTMDNQGHGGYRVVNYMEGDLSTMPMLEALPTDGSVYLFEGGINDWRNTEIKVSTGTSRFMSFKDALQRIATYMLTNMPKALHLWFTPHYCLTMVDGTATDTVNGETLEDYANAMINVAEKNGIPCVDMYHLCGWRSENISTFVNNESGAYIHPNADGGIRMSALILNGLKRIEPMTDYTVNGSESGGSGSGGGESGGSGTGTSEGLPSDVLFAPTRIGITQGGNFTNYTELSGSEITKISDTNYKLNLASGSGKYLAIETGTADNIRLAVKKISGTLNATLYHATSLTATNGAINTLADSHGDIQTPLACNNGSGIILVSITQAINAEIYVFKGNSYTGSSTTDEEKKQIENTFTT